MPIASSHAPTESLARLLRQKRRILEQLAGLARRQEQLVQEGQIATLLQLLSGKQQLIAALGVVEQGLDAFREEDPDSRVWSSSADRDACRADAAACNTLLQEVLAAEQRHEAELSTRRDDLAGRLKQAQSAHAATTAYKPHLAAARVPTPATDADPGQPPLSACLDLSTAD